jgi:hypothetical protein
MPAITLLLSFDHELSLGGTSSYQANLFEPTEKLLDLAKELSVPITLFTDVLCAMRFRDWDQPGFYVPWREQIERTISEGHDVQLHLHPHWLDSKYEAGRFIPANTFALGDFLHREPPHDIPGIVKQSVDFLTEHCRRARSDYRCVAFRAGGYNLAPATAVIISSLLDNGIRIDSSISKGYYFKSGISEVNYRLTPEPPNWFFSPGGGPTVESATGLFEVPIAARPRTPINNIPFLVKRVLLKGRAFSTGRGIHSGHTSRREKLARMFPRSTWHLSFDEYTDSPGDLMKILKRHVARHSRYDRIICSAIGHPKSMGPYALSLMRRFIEEARHEYGSGIAFCTFRRVFDELHLADAPVELH